MCQSLSTTRETSGHSATTAPCIPPLLFVVLLPIPTSGPTFLPTQLSPRTPLCRPLQPASPTRCVSVYAPQAQPSGQSPTKSLTSLILSDTPRPPTALDVAFGITFFLKHSDAFPRGSVNPPAPSGAPLPQPPAIAGWLSCPVAVPRNSPFPSHRALTRSPHRLVLRPQAGGRPTSIEPAAQSPADPWVFSQTRHALQSPDQRLPTAKPICSRSPPTAHTGCV